MSRLGFTFEINKCIGCMACLVACKDKNQLEVGNYFRRVETFKSQDNYIHFSGGCYHCQGAACIKNCPTEAMYREVDGVVGHDAGKCIGCGSCIWSCPYGAVKFSKKKGVAQKCNACGDLRAKGKKPACVQACITHCLDFGEILITGHENHFSFLPSPHLTHPNVNFKK